MAGEPVSVAILKLFKIESHDQFPRARRLISAAAASAAARSAALALFTMSGGQRADFAQLQSAVFARETVYSRSRILTLYISSGEV